MKVVVDYDNLMTILEEYVVGFNDCACCPCYFDKCTGEDGINENDCAKIIFDNYILKEEEK